MKRVLITGAGGFVGGRLAAYYRDRWGITPLDHKQLDLTDSQAVDLLREAFAAGAAWEGPMPGKSARECGNCQNLDTDLARAQCRYYAELIRDWTAEKLAY